MTKTTVNGTNQTMKQILSGGEGPQKQGKGKVFWLIYMAIIAFLTWLFITMGTAHWQH